MTPKYFVDTYKDDAKQSQVETGISFIAALAQGAVESAWGSRAPGNNFFGIKAGKNWTGEKQLLQTSEYSKKDNLKFPEIISIKPVTINGISMFKYVIKDYFRKYATPAECFTDHGKFFLNNQRYAEALKVKSDPRLFVNAIALAGYATDPNYASTLNKVISMIEVQLK